MKEIQQISETSKSEVGVDAVPLSGGGGGLRSRVTKAVFTRKRPGIFLEKM